jgi:hypothetical protein
MSQRLKDSVLGTALAVVVGLGLSGCATQKPIKFGQRTAPQADGLAEAGDAKIMPSSYAQPVNAPQPNTTQYSKAAMASWARPYAPAAYGNSGRRAQGGSCFT